MRRNAVMPVEAVMSPPPGTERVGDEFHDPNNWQACPNCGLDNPMDYERCFDCREPLP